MSVSVLGSIRELLQREHVVYREVQHAPTRTSEESARARGESIEIGAKALLLKTDDCFRLFVMSAARKLDSARLKDHLQLKKLRFATPGELHELTGLVPGSVPPFGYPILPFDLYLDVSISNNERVAFNAGSLTDSMILSAADYLRIAKPKEIFEFT